MSPTRAAVPAVVARWAGYDVEALMVPLVYGFVPGSIPIGSAVVCGLPVAVPPLSSSSPSMTSGSRPSERIGTFARRCEIAAIRCHREGLSGEAATAILLRPG